MDTKLMGLAEAAFLVKSGASIPIGGFTSQRHPTALLRKLVRQNVRNLVVYYHSASSDVDLLVGAGSARRLQGAYPPTGCSRLLRPTLEDLCKRAR